MGAIVTIQTRNGTAAQWTAANPVLALGEQGLESDTRKVKYGDGVTAWNSLAYAGATLPIATTSVLGGVISDGNSINIDGTGVISTVSVGKIKQQVKNDTGSPLLKGQAVYVNGANGTNVTIALAQANAESTSSKTLGLLEADIANGGTGYVVTEGVLTGLNTNAAANEGDPVWLSPTVAGGLVYGVANKPLAPYHLVYMGVVSRKNANNGEIFIKVQNGYELEELHNVLITNPVNGNVLRYDSVTSLWKNDALPAGSGTVTSVAALTLGTTGTDVSSTVANSTTTPVITLNIPTANATNRGALSAADWTTFNNKLSSLPTASTLVLGGVKVDGTTITIDSNGIISSYGSYTLPTASTTVLGGVKVDGTSITINGSGVISSVGGGGGGSGTVTSVSIVSANGLTGTVADATTTPAITLTTSVTGILKGDGTALSAAIASDFPTLNQDTTGYASALKSASTTVSVSAATAPTTGQVLTATSETAATWQTPSGISASNANNFTGTQTFNGTSTTLAAVFANAAETTTVSATAATGTIAYYTNSQSVMYYTSNASANWTLNLTHSAGTTLNTAMAVGQTVTVTFMVTQGATAYYNNVVQVDGTTTGVTTKWQGGTAPTSGNASAIDVYTYAIIKTADATFSILAAVSKFA